MSLKLATSLLCDEQKQRRAPSPIAERKKSEEKIGKSKIGDKLFV